MASRSLRPYFALFSLYIFCISSLSFVRVVTILVSLVRSLSVFPASDKYHSTVNETSTVASGTPWQVSVKLLELLNVWLKIYITVSVMVGTTNYIVLSCLAWIQPENWSVASQVIITCLLSVGLCLLSLTTPRMPCWRWNHLTRVALGRTRTLSAQADVSPATLSLLSDKFHSLVQCSPLNSLYQLCDHLCPFSLNWYISEQAVSVVWACATWLKITL